MLSSAVVVLVVILVALPPGGNGSRIENYVVGGFVADEGKYPFVVSLRRRHSTNGVNGRHFCGASIISESWILTAAHCVRSKTAEEIAIQYGANEISPEDVDNVADVKTIIKYENYSPMDQHANDIALLELEVPLPIDGTTIAAINLPEQGFEVPVDSEGNSDSLATLVGWGRTEDFGPTQRELLEVELKVYSDEECNERHKGRTTPDQLCAGVDEGGKGQCRGDSGGPLIYDGSIQIGIVSWSIKPCTIPPYPGVYTKVSHYVDWISENIY